MIRIHHTHQSSGNRARRRSMSVAYAFVLSLALVACGKKDEPAPAAPGAPATSPPATPAAPAPVLPVSELLQKAKAAEKEQKLVTPATDNAMSYYLQIIAQEPTNPQATQALVDLFPIAASSAESAIAARNVEEAERIVGLLDKSSPGSYTVTTLRAKLDAQRAAADRLEVDRLAQEQRSLEVKQQQAAAALAAAAEPAAPPPAEPAPAPAEVADATPPPSEPAAPATPPPAAATPPAATPPTATAGQSRDVRLVRQVPPAFPPDAVRKRVSGWVEVRFTVGPQGAVTAAEVVRSQPSRTFDRAALEAVRQWKFDPALRNGEPVAAQRTQRIEFKL